MIKFPSGFLWGAATSAYQVEGNNRNSDWWQWEKDKGKERSGPACRHYQLYRKDFDLAQRLHHNAHRLSIEWSRIEPSEGRFSQKELKHYLDVILALKKRDIEPIVTLHHFTNPAWFSKMGGWLNPRAVGLYLRYCELVVSALAKHVYYWVTINEPTIYISHAYILGVWPPQEKSYLKAAIVEENLALAHMRAYNLIKKIYQGLNFSHPYVGIAQHLIDYVPHKRDFKNQLAVYLRDRLYNMGFLERVMGHNPLHKHMDFIGLNYYSRQVVDLKKSGLENLALDVLDKKRSRIQTNSLGWAVYPKGIYDLLLELKHYNLPVMITENGICTGNDAQRWKYIYSHLRYIHRAMSKGVEVIGYLYWSLLDNFEWDKGFTPRFGLIDVDYNTFKRTTRPSARKFARICQTGILH